MATTKKKAPAKAAKPRKTAKHAAMRSFKRSPETTPFMTFKTTHQTVYWLIIGLFVLGIGIWMISLNIKVQKLYDQVEANKSVEIHKENHHH